MPLPLNLESPKVIAATHIVGREIVMINNSDRRKAGDFDQSHREMMIRFVMRHPHARLVRDTVGGCKYQVYSMGSGSSIHGQGDSALGAWVNAICR